MSFVQMRLALLGAAAATVIGILALGPAPALAAVNVLKVSAGEYGANQRVSVGLNKSVLVDLPADVKEVIVSQPGMATAVMRSKRRAFIQGTGAGETNIFFLDANGNAISVVEISVVHDASTLTASLRKSLPGSQIQVQSFGERVVLTGNAMSAEDVDKATAIAAQFTGDAESVANLVNSGSGQQVMLKVTIAEVARNQTHKLGINFNASYNNGGGFSTTLDSNPITSTGATGNTLVANVGVGAVQLQATLDALNAKGASRILAEPTLTALSGEEANFLAGGEIPFATSNQDGTTINYKPYGIELKFTPVVKSNGIVGLTVDTSVSELSGTQGALTKRGAKTSVELASGSTLAIGGLISDSVRQQINGLPVLGNVPILGALFRSREFIKDQTELVILVTPYIAQARTGPVALPTDRHIPAGDAEGIFLGRLEAMYGVGNPDGALRGGFQGSVGFVLD